MVNDHTGHDGASCCCCTQVAVVANEARTLRTELAQHERRELEVMERHTTENRDAHKLLHQKIDANGTEQQQLATTVAVLGDRLGRSGPWALVGGGAGGAAGWVAWLLYEWVNRGGG